MNEWAWRNILSFGKVNFSGGDLSEVQPPPFPLYEESTPIYIFPPITYTWKLEEKE
jgi:hypothetical protein